MGNISPKDKFKKEGKNFMWYGLYPISDYIYGKYNVIKVQIMRRCFWNANNGLT